MVISPVDDLYYYLNDSKDLMVAAGGGGGHSRTALHGGGGYCRTCRKPSDECTCEFFESEADGFDPVINGSDLKQIYTDYSLIYAPMPTPSQYLYNYQSATGEKQTAGYHEFAPYAPLWRSGLGFGADIGSKGGWKKDCYADFVQKYKATVMGHLRFINADDSNRSRCSTCSWWVSFLETLTGSKLSSGPVKTVQFRKTLHWFNHSVAPTFWGLTACLGIEFLTCLHETGRNKIKERQLQLIEDYMNNRDGVDKECPNLWAFFASAVCGGYQEALDRLKKDSIYINNIPSCMDKREWLNMVFADCEGVSV